METLPVYKTFSNKEAAYRIAALLEDHEIRVIVEEYTPLLDSNFIGVSQRDPFALKIRGEDFITADKIIRDNTVIKLEEIDKDYMLLSFTSDELISVMANEEEWGIYNAKLAEVLLRERNIEIPENRISNIKQFKAAEKAAPEKLSPGLIILGYISAVAGTVNVVRDYNLPVVNIYLPGILAIGIGSILIGSKKTLSDGTQVHYFNHSNRLHGKIMLCLSVSVFLVKIIRMIIS